MEFRSYPLNGKLLKQQKRSAKIYAEKEFSNELDDVSTFRRRITFQSAVHEWVPSDPHRTSPSNEGNISGGSMSEISTMATMASPIRSQTY